MSANAAASFRYFAITAAWAVEKELALQQLEAGLRAPAASLILSYGALKLLPVWHLLRAIRASTKSSPPRAENNENFRTISDTETA